MVVVVTRCDTSIIAWVQILLSMGGQVKVIISLRSRPVAHQDRAYPRFQGMNRLGVFLFPPGWDACPS